MRTLVFAIAGIAGISGASVMGGPLERQNIPREAVWVLHVDVERLLAYEVGRLVQEHVAEQGSPARDQMIAKLNLDPLSDILGMTFYGETFGEHEGVVILTTTRAAEEAAGRLAGLGLAEYASREVDGVRVHRWVQDGKTLFAAVLAGARGEERRVVLSGSEERLLSAAETIHGGTGEVGVPDPEGATVYAWARGLAQAPSPPRAATLRGIASLTVRMGQRVDEAGESVVYARADLTAVSEKRAGQIESMFKGMLSTVEMMGEDNPDFRPLSDLAGGASVTVDGANVTISWSHPVRALMDTFRRLSGKGSKAAKPQEGVAAPAR
jgi:hypothetical protein